MSHTLHLIEQLVCQPTLELASTRLERATQLASQNFAGAGAGHGAASAAVDATYPMSTWLARHQQLYHGC